MSDLFFTSVKINNLISSYALEPSHERTVAIRAGANSTVVLKYGT